MNEKKSSRIIAAVLLAAIAMLLGACGGTSASTSPTPIPPTDTAIPATPSPTPIPPTETAPYQEYWSIADLSSLESALESGKYERVRALFTEDGVMTTADNTFGVFRRGELETVADSRVDGSEFRRLATLHGGEDFTILGTPIQVSDNTVAFGWRWRQSGVLGTAILHLRDGKIVEAILNVSNYSIHD